MDSGCRQLDRQYVQCVPLQSNNQFRLAVRELLNFSKVLGYVMCQDETSDYPSSGACLYYLAENAVARIRWLAGTLMEIV